MANDNTQTALKSILRMLRGVRSDVDLIKEKFSVQGLMLLHPLEKERLVSACVVTADMPYRGYNWYPPESDGRHHWRWSGPGRLSTVLLPLNRKAPLRLEISQVNFHRSQAVRPELRGFVDGSEVPVEANAGHTKFSLPIAPSMEQKYFTEVGFLTSDTATASEQDPRWIGFSFASMVVEPALDADPIADEHAPE